jgi:hypothetical protein
VRCHLESSKNHLMLQAIISVRFWSWPSTLFWDNATGSLSNWLQPWHSVIWIYNNYKVSVTWSHNIRKRSLSLRYRPSFCDPYANADFMYKMWRQGEARNISKCEVGAMITEPPHPVLECPPRKFQIPRLGFMLYRSLMFLRPAPCDSCWWRPALLHLRSLW